MLQSVIRAQKFTVEQKLKSTIQL